MCELLRPSELGGQMGRQYNTGDRGIVSPKNISDRSSGKYAELKTKAMVSCYIHVYHK